MRLITSYRLCCWVSILFGLAVLGVCSNAAPAHDNRGASLLQAVAKADIAAAQQLLAQGANPNIRDEHGRTPLMLAMNCCAAADVSLPIVQALLNKGANVNAKDGSDTYVLEYAINSKSWPGVKMLISKGANVNAREQHGQSPLGRAVDVGYAPIVQLLLTAGAKLRVDKDGVDLLSRAAGYGYLEVVKLLIAKGAEVNAADEYGNTPLMAAAQGGQAQVVEFLLSRGAAVNAKDTRGQTALLQAATYGQLPAAKVLLAHGANANVKDTDGSTALVSAIVSSMGRQDAELVRLLLTHGANPNDANDEEPPLIWAAKVGETQAVQLLLEKGANPQTGDIMGGTALLAVLKEGNHQRAQMQLYAFGGVLSEAQKTALEKQTETADATIVKALLEHGVDVTKGQNRTALIYAAATGNVPIVQLLLDKGAPINVNDMETLPALMTQMKQMVQSYPKQAAAIQADMSQTRDALQGLTPLMAAAANGNPEVVNLLLDKGADPNLKDRNGKTALSDVVAAGRTSVAWTLPQMREGILHRANEGAEKSVSPEVSAQEKAIWQQWADAGDTAIIQALVAKNADVNVRDKQGHTPLMEAAVNGNPAIVQALLQAKADVNATDNVGQTALLQVVANGRLQHAPELFSQELQTSLSMANRYRKTNATLEQKKWAAEVRSKATAQKSAVLREATDMDLAVLKKLKAGGADINVKDKNGHTALQIATQLHHTAIEQWLQKQARSNN